MPVTKHKIFKVKISDDGRFTISKAVRNTIDNFLSEPNTIYINHSITTLTEDVEEYDNMKTLCKYILISIIYKDLDGTSLNVKSTSKKMRETVQREIGYGNVIEEPKIFTDLDKEIIQLVSKDEDGNISTKER